MQTDQVDHINRRSLESPIDEEQLQKSQVCSFQNNLQLLFQLSVL